MVSNHNSLVYERPNFDSNVIFRLHLKRVIKVSRKVYYGPEGFGSFYKIRLRGKPVGYIADSDVELLKAQKHPVKPYVGVEGSLFYSEGQSSYAVGLRSQVGFQKVIWDLKAQYIRNLKRPGDVTYLLQAGVNFTHYVKKRAYVYSLVGGYFRHRMYVENSEEGTEHLRSLGLVGGVGLGFHVRDFMFRVESYTRIHPSVIALGAGINLQVAL